MRKLGIGEDPLVVRLMRGTRRKDTAGLKEHRASKRGRGVGMDDAAWKGRARGMAEQQDGGSSSVGVGIMGREAVAVPS